MIFMSFYNLLKKKGTEPAAFLAWDDFFVFFAFPRRFVIVLVNFLKKSENILQADLVDLWIFL